MNVLQGLDLVHIKVLGILSADYSRISPKQVFFFFFFESSFNVSLMLDVSLTEVCILTSLGEHHSKPPRRPKWMLLAVASLSGTVRSNISNCLCQWSLQPSGYSSVH